MDGLACLELNLKKLRSAKKSTMLSGDKQGTEVQLDVIRKHYLTVLQNSPDILTVRDMKSLFGATDKFILDLLHSKKVKAVKVEGKYLAPKQSLVTFLESAIFSTMVQFHQTLWMRIS
jgi:ribosomal protein S24E